MLVGVDDMDSFKGIELKLQAFERLLDHHPEWRGKLVLVQVRGGWQEGKAAGWRSAQCVAAGHRRSGGFRGRLRAPACQLPTSVSTSRAHTASCHARLPVPQVTNPPRSSGKDITELHSYVTELVDTINRKYGRAASNYLPVHYLERHVPLHERMAYYRQAQGLGTQAGRNASA